MHDISSVHAKKTAIYVPCMISYAELREKIKAMCKEQTIGDLASEMKLNRKIII